MSHTAGLRITKLPDDFEKIYNFKNVTETVGQFKDEPLILEPGTKFEYSNYGFQIIGGIIESVLNETYENAMNKMFKELGMSSTFAERHEMIIPHRVRYYMKSDSFYIQYFQNTTNSTKVQLLNSLIIDDLLSLEANWPSGGLGSTVPDLLKFGNYLLNSYKGVNDSKSGTRMKFDNICDKFEKFLLKKSQTLLQKVINSHNFTRNSPKNRIKIEILLVLNIFRLSQVIDC
jgi:CubicO group peptidase (beta-lactamase class C family)